MWIWMFCFNEQVPNIMLQAHGQRLDLICSYYEPSMLLKHPQNKIF